ncbi:NAD(P)-dependent oxidoreductase [Sphingomonas bacterium]|uniref:NAD(P)-dependent oxidoreductase n=1 Tax=Sphingomonas bacterium TaxID=1895847 RepID=UPI0015769493|nr:NAD(P)-dependent oxidoreductase [Sphingomonas bacterium]
MAKPALLLWTPNMGAMVGSALEERFDLIRLWEAEDADAAIDARAADIVATLTIKEPIGAALLDRLPNLRVIAVPGAGYEGVDVAAARARGIVVANAGDTHSGDVADQAVALALASLQRLFEMDAWTRADRWRREGLPPRRRSLASERFGIVGLGYIGAAIATRLAPFGGDVAWWAPRDKEAPWPRLPSLLALAQWCTTLIVAARGDATGLIDADVIAAVGSDGLIVNIARGAVIDEDALIAALKEGRLGRAALDVFAEEPTPPARWEGVPNVILAPHVGGLTNEAMARLRDAAIHNLLTALDGGPVVNEIFA